MATTEERTEALAEALGVNKWQVDRVLPNYAPYYDLTEEDMEGAGCFRVSVETENSSEESLWIVATEDEANRLAKRIIRSSVCYDLIEGARKTGGVMKEMAPVCNGLWQVGVDLLVHQLNTATLSRALVSIIEMRYPGGWERYMEDAIDQMGIDYFLSPYGEDGKPLGGGLKAYRV